jgi:hypothetical protein
MSSHRYHSNSKAVHQLILFDLNLDQVATAHMTFRYDPLKNPEDDIRIVVLEPGTAIEPISCKDFHAALSTEPDHHALSYAWGSSELSHSITILGCTYHVTKNLHDALRHIRNTQTAPFLWIDAICINQSDIPERNSQVLRMRDIYRSADGVIVWLGLAADDSDLAIDWIAEVAQRFPPFDGGNGCSSCSFTTPEGETYVKSIQGSTNIRIWRALLSLLVTRDYWERTWIIQELVSGTPRIIFFCGMKWFRCRDVLRALEFVEYFNDTAPCTPRTDFFYNTRSVLGCKLYAVYGPLRQLGPLSRVHTLFNVMCKARTCKVSEVRDKVYALLGLMDEPMCPPRTRTIPVDYRRSILDVYTDIVQFFAQSTGCYRELEWRERAKSSTEYFYLNLTDRMLCLQRELYYWNGPLDVLCMAWPSPLAKELNFPSWVQTGLMPITATFSLAGITPTLAERYS